MHSNRRILTGNQSDGHMAFEETRTSTIELKLKVLNRASTFDRPKSKLTSAHYTGNPTMSRIYNQIDHSPFISVHSTVAPHLTTTPCSSHKNGESQIPCAQSRMMTFPRACGEPRISPELPAVPSRGRPFPWEARHPTLERNTRRSRVT